MSSNLEELLERMSGMAESNGPDYGNIEAINVALDAANPAKAERFAPRQVIYQKKLGTDYTRKQEEKPAVFVRYLTEAERIACFRPDKEGSPVRGYDMLFAAFAHPQTGHPNVYLGMSWEFTSTAPSATPDAE